MFSRGSRFAALAVAALVVTGCGSSVSGNSAPAELDVRTLDVGKYATDPLEMHYTYNPDLRMGTSLALMRLANQVVNGPDIDPNFKYGTGFEPFADAEGATAMLADDTAPVLERNNLLFGLSVGHAEQPVDKSGKAPDGTPFTTVTVMQFPDEAAANRAAAGIEEADFAFAAGENQKLSVPKYPAAQAHWRPGVPTIGSTMARGSYVISIFAGVKEADSAQLTALVEKIYNAQAPLLDALKPLSREDILRMPYDPDGMLRQTLNADGIGIPDFEGHAVFELRGFLHMTGEQDYWSRVMKDSGVDRYSFSKSMANYSRLFRARDAAAAGNLASVILDKSYPGVADAPAGVPGAECGETTAKTDYSTKRFRCVLTYRNYVATVEGDQIGDAHQRAAAQYALLANSTW
ncbi:DUF7373 family lipoprotein [Nocardia sp. IFM 10818]